MRSKKQRLAFGLIVVLLLVVAAIALPKDVASLLALATTGSAGWGMTQVFVIYVISALAFLPTAVVTILAGYLYGTWYGSLLICGASLATALIAFAITRFLAYDLVMERVAAKPWYEKFRREITTDGFFLVLIARLSAIVPAAPLNYAAGTTPVRLRDFFWGTLFGQTPIKVVLAFLGATSSEVFAGGGFSLTETIRWKIAGAVVALLAISLVGVWIRRRFHADKTPHQG